VPLERLLGQLGDLLADLVLLADGE